MAESTTKAVLARHVGGLARYSAAISAELAEGMWNPDYCASDGKEWAKRIVREIYERLAELELRFDINQDS